MEFVDAGPKLVSRYDPHPGPPAQYVMHSYNPPSADHGALFAPKLAPHMLRNPIPRTVFNHQARAEIETNWHKGGYAVNSPERMSKHANPFDAVSTASMFGLKLKEAAASSPNPIMRGGWPADGGYSRDKGSWFAGSPPSTSPDKKGFMTYNWRHHNFVNTSPLGADGSGFK